MRVPQSTAIPHGAGHAKRDTEPPQRATTNWHHRSSLLVLLPSDIFLSFPFLLQQQSKCNQIYSGFVLINYTASIPWRVWVYSNHSEHKHNLRLRCNNTVLLNSLVSIYVKHQNLYIDSDPNSEDLYFFFYSPNGKDYYSLISYFFES